MRRKQKKGQKFLAITMVRCSYIIIVLSCLSALTSCQESIDKALTHKFWYMDEGAGRLPYAIYFDDHGRSELYSIRDNWVYALYDTGDDRALNYWKVRNDSVVELNWEYHVIKRSRDEIVLRSAAPVKDKVLTLRLVPQRMICEKYLEKTLRQKNDCNLPYNARKSFKHIITGGKSCFWYFKSRRILDYKDYWCYQSYWAYRSGLRAYDNHALYFDRNGDWRIFDVVDSCVIGLTDYSRDSLWVEITPQYESWSYEHDTLTMGKMKYLIKSTSVDTIVVEPLFRTYNARIYDDTGKKTSVRTFFTNYSADTLIKVPKGLIHPCYRYGCNKR